MKYQHQRQGDTVKVEIKDFTRRLIYRSKFNIKDKNAILALLQIIETYSGFSVAEIIKSKLESGWIQEILKTTCSLLLAGVIMKNTFTAKAIINKITKQISIQIPKKKLCMFKDKSPFALKLKLLEVKW